MLNFQRRVNVTIPLPQPAQAGSVGREIAITADGSYPAVYDLATTQASYTFAVARNAKVHVELYDLDSEGNRSIAASTDLVAVTKAQMPTPGALGTPVISDQVLPAHPTATVTAPAVASPTAAAPASTPAIGQPVT